MNKTTLPDTPMFNRSCFYRSPKNSSKVTTGLFKELVSGTHPDTFVIFTLREDAEGLTNNTTGKPLSSFPDLYRKYCKADPTEYAFAIAVFGEWTIWADLAKEKRIKPFVDRLREEVQIIVKSEALLAITSEMVNNGKSAFSAAKLLLEKNIINDLVNPEPKQEASTMTPTQKRKAKLVMEKDAEMNERAVDLLTEDAARLNLRIVR